MNKRSLIQQATVVAAFGVTLFGFQNCANNYKIDATGGATVASAAGTVDPGSGTVTSDPNPVPTSTPATVCNPFGGGTTATAGQGLAADSIHYLTAAQTSSGVSNFSNLWNNGLGVEPVNMILSEINVPNVYFSQGFKTDAGSVLDATDGSVLSAYFGFEAKGYLVLGDWAPGDYQIAVLSDDGSILTISGGVSNADGSKSDFVINNDGNHSMQMGCSSSVVHLDANSRLPLSFNYYQGPPTTIGLMIIARPVPAGNPQDAQCGKGGSNDGYFFNDRNYPAASVAQQPYLDIVNRGWTVIDASHYQLPTSVAPTSCTTN